VSRPWARGAEGSDESGEKRSRGGGAGVSGGGVVSWVNGGSLSGALRAGTASLGRGLSFSRGRLLSFLERSSLSSPVLSFEALALTLAGEASGSVFTLSEKHVS